METNSMKFYRYEARVYEELDRDGEFCSPNIRIPKIELMEFNLHKETPKGYWIGYGHLTYGYWTGRPNLSSNSRWVSKTSVKRYAYPTKEEALINYIKRTEVRIRILKSQLEECEYGLMNAKSIKITE